MGGGGGGGSKAIWVTWVARGIGVTPVWYPPSYLNIQNAYKKKKWKLKIKIELWISWAELTFSKSYL